MMQAHPNARALNKHSRNRLVERLTAEEIENIAKNQAAQAAKLASSIKAAVTSKATAILGPPATHKPTAPPTTVAKPSVVTPPVLSKPATTPPQVTTPAVKATTAPTTAPTTAKALPTTAAPASSADDDEDLVTASSSSSKARATSSSSHSSSSHAKTITQSGTVSSSMTGIRAMTPPAVSSARLSGTAAAGNASSSSKGMSGGAVAGIVIAVLLAVAAIGAFLMYFKKKASGRGYNKGNGWSKMDDDVTPFPSHGEKPATGYYGAASPTGAGAGGGYGAAACAAGAAGGAAAAYGSTRNLAVQNSFYADGRPQSEMAENFAGYGAGRVHGTTGVAAVAPVASYPIQQGYADNMYSPDHIVPSPYYGNPNEYEQQHGMQHQQAQYSPFDDPAYSPTHDSSSSPRQLVGPGQAYQAYGDQAYLAGPVPLGRPEAPNSYDDIAAAEMYADDRYADDHMAAPVPLAMPVPSHSSPAQTNAHLDAPYSPHDQRLSPAPDHDHELPDELLAEKYHYEQEAAHDFSAPGGPVKNSPRSDTIPQLAPMSPFLDPIALPNNAAATSTDVVDDDETARMYEQVAAAAGLPPTGSAPYQHGQPLAPVREVATPMSEARPLPGTPVTPSRHPLPATPTPPPGTPKRLPPVSSLPSDDAYGGI